MKIYVTTNGCVEGQLSSTFAEEFFAKNNSTMVNMPSAADIVVFYACGLTEPKEQDSLILVRSLKKQMKPSAKLVVWGCLPKINPKSLKAVNITQIIGPNDTRFLEELLEKPSIRFDDIKCARPANMLVPSQPSGVFTYSKIGAGARWLTGYNFWDGVSDSILLLKQDWLRLQKRAHKSNAMFIRLGTGCTGHCTYCSERCAFGEVQSRSRRNIMSEFKWGLKQGYSEFSLIATDLGAYGLDSDCTLVDLLKEMIKVGGRKNYRIILNQLNAFYLKRYFSDLEPVFASEKIGKLCSPVQSGSNRILRLMGRMHTAEEWKEYMLRTSTLFPHIQLGTQFMVGFPTETEEDFGQTLKLLDYPLSLDFINIFKYSGRPDVPAARLSGQISQDIKELRYKRLLRRQARMHILNTGISFLHAMRSKTAAQKHLQN